jgi:Sensors of blue-light using FAD
MHRSARLNNGMKMHGTLKKTTTPESLYRLIYRSRAMIAATDAALQREVRVIVSAARERNKADNVTGALLFTDAGFAQVLEGPREVLERTFERIVEDRRHADVTVLSFTPAHRRYFPNWPMGFYGRILGYADPSGHLVATGSEILRLLERMVQQEDAWVGGAGSTAEINPAAGSPAPAP